MKRTLTIVRPMSNDARGVLHMALSEALETWVPLLLSLPPKTGIRSTTPLPNEGENWCSLLSKIRAVVLSSFSLKKSDLAIKLGISERKGLKP